jgi:hypothetical protein
VLSSLTIKPIIQDTRNHEPKKIFMVNKTIIIRAGPAFGCGERDLALGADFEGAPKRRSPTGHTLIRLV